MSIIEKAVDRLGKEGSNGAGSEQTVEVEVASEAPDSAEIGQGADRVSPAAPGADQHSEIEIRGLRLEGIISPDSNRSRTAEEFRMIKRPLLQTIAEKDESNQHANLVMITSALAGEGKTFTSLNLAISMAMEMDHTVLLIDADVARPGLSRLLRIEDRPGLLDCLDVTSANLGEVMLRSDIPKLTLVPAGSHHIRATELLGSNVMRRLLDEIALRYPDRIVLFDSPPLLETTEASVLGNRMGQILVVVESGVTRQHLVKEALSQLDDLEKVSLILNKTQSSLFFSRYSYSYGYGYNYQYGQYGQYGREGE